MSKALKVKGIEQNGGETKFYGERVVFFPPNIITLLGSVFGQGSKSMLVYLGKKMGRRFVETWEENEHPENYRALTDLFVEKTSIAGWGQFSVVSFTESEIVLNLTTNIAKSEEMPLCHIGYLAALGEYMMYNAKVTEEECSIDDPSLGHCLFKIQKR